jgi:hypothetical protein
VPAADHLAGRIHDDGSHRYVGGGLRQEGLGEREPHPPGVPIVIHERSA